MTFNIRYGTAEDGPNHWENRKNKVFDLIAEEDCDFVGIQEALAFQVAELQDALPQYAYVGRTREADNRGEASPIFYKRELWNCLEHGVFWLSETPEDEGSVGWDARLPRIATWAKFLHRKSGLEVFVYNTHYSHVSDNARIESSKLLASDIEKRADDRPVLLTGDFNAIQSSEAITTLTARMTDTYRQINRTAPGETAFGWRPHIVGTGKRIDYIFCSQHFAVHDAYVIDRAMDGGYPSDHNPVVAQVSIPW
jgi:endonuclease/exonuclease/phosphatase family metal-dependent hydrolase